MFSFLGYVFPLQCQECCSNDKAFGTCLGGAEIDVSHTFVFRDCDWEMG